MKFAKSISVTDLKGDDSTIALLNDSILYKYVSIEKALLILENRTLNFTNPKYFNDPLDCYEGIINLKYSDKEIKNLMGKAFLDSKYSHLTRNQRRKFTNFQVLTKANFQSYQERVILEMKEKIGVCCFSSIKDNILMWSHYSENHKGVCIGFKLPHILEDKFVIYPVEYKKQITLINHNSPVLKALKYWVLTKAFDWEYEKEFRAVNLNYNGIIEIDPSFIDSIYFGCKITPEDKGKIKMALRKGLRHVTQHQMEINKETFGLSVRSNG